MSKPTDTVDAASWIRQEILDLEAYHLALPDCKAKLNQNESPLAPAAIRQTLQEAAETFEFHRYPTPSCEALRAALSRQLQWPAEGFVVANGSNVLVQALVIAAAVGKTVMTVTPSFGVYALQAQALAKKLVEVPLSQDFEFPEGEFLQRMRSENPALIFFADPNAPTGNLFAESAIAAVIEQAKGLVVVDEAYFPFSQRSFFVRLARHPNLVIMRTFSKSAALAGARLGYIAGHPAVMREIEKVLLPFRVSALTESLGIRALANHRDEDERVKQTLSERERVLNGLSAFADLKVYPSRANFILFRLNKPERAREVFQKVLGHGVLLRDFSKSPGLEGCLRVSIGSVDENDLFLKAMKEALNG